MKGGGDRRGDWLSADAYDALSAAEKREIWRERKRRSRAAPRRGPHRTKSSRDLSWTGFVLFAALMAGAVTWKLTPANWSSNRVAAASGVPQVRADFGLCHTGGGRYCVVDGDTIWLAGEKIRIADIDAPETHEYACAEEKALGDKATRRLHDLVNSGVVTLGSIDRDHDVYGRKLRLVFVDGVGVGDTLVNEGLARYYQGGRRPWC